MLSLEAASFPCGDPSSIGNAPWEKSMQISSLPEGKLSLVPPMGVSGLTDIPSNVFKALTWIGHWLTRWHYRHSFLLQRRVNWIPHPIIICSFFSKTIWSAAYNLGGPLKGVVPSGLSLETPLYEPLPLSGRLMAIYLNGRHVTLHSHRGRCRGNIWVVETTPAKRTAPILTTPLIL